MADLETLQTRLAEAEAARHAIATGSAVEEVWRDGRRVTYTSASLSQLAAYIDDLNRQIAAIEGAASGALPRRRFIGVGFR